LKASDQLCSFWFGYLDKNVNVLCLLVFWSQVMERRLSMYLSHRVECNVCGIMNEEFKCATKMHYFWNIDPNFPGF